MQEDITSEALPDGVDVALAGGEETVSENEGASSEAIEKVLSNALGKRFASREAALKAVKDTFDFVGKAGTYRQTVKELSAKFGTDESGVLKLMEDFRQSAPPSAEKPEGSTQVQPQVEPKEFVTREEFEEMAFYSKNPEYESHRKLLTALRKGTGQSLNNIVVSDDFKAIFEKAKSYDEQEKSRTVLQSSPRIGAVTDKMDKARTALKENRDGDAKSSAVSAVFDAFDVR